MNKGF